MRKVRDRLGFTLAEVLVSVALIAVLASVTIPTIRGRLRDGYEDAIVQEFDDLASAITAYQQNVGKYPPTLDYLTALPTTPFSPTDFCGNNLTARQISNWRGPYVARAISNVNYSIGQDATVEVALGSGTVTSLNNGSQPSITIIVDGPDQTTANDIDIKIDGSADAVNGTLTWQASGSGTRIFYNIPIRKGAC